LQELDTEAAEERYGDEFDPEKELRDYDAIANALPVFCVSSRGIYPCYLFGKTCL
jgi:hypothetical protein